MIRQERLRRRLALRGPPTVGRDIQQPSLMNDRLRIEMGAIFNSPENWKKVWEE